MGGDAAEGHGWDEATFEAYFRGYVQQVARFTERRLEGNEALWDVVSDIFATAWAHNRTAPAGQEAVLAWLYGFSVNVVRNSRRAGRRRRLAEKAASNLAEAGTNAFEAVDEAMTAQLQLGQGFAKLSHDDKEVLALAAWEGLSLAALAVSLGVTEATAKKRAQRARRRLREALAEGGAYQGPGRPGPPSPQPGLEL